MDENNKPEPGISINTNSGEAVSHLHPKSGTISDTQLQMVLDRWTQMNNANVARISSVEQEVKATATQIASHRQLTKDEQEAINAKYNKMAAEQAEVLYALGRPTAANALLGKKEDERPAWSHKRFAGTAIRIEHLEWAGVATATFFVGRWVYGKYIKPVDEITVTPTSVTTKKS